MLQVFQLLLIIAGVSSCFFARKENKYVATGNAVFCKSLCWKTECFITCIRENLQAEFISETNVCCCRMSGNEYFKDEVWTGVNKVMVTF